MIFNWNTLSPAQAAVFAALIGILSAVLGQLIGGIINVVSSARQAGKNRQLEERKLRLQLGYQLDQVKVDRKRGAYLSFHAAAHATFQQIATTRTYDGDRQHEVIANLNAALVDVALADASAEVQQACNAILESLTNLSAEQRPAKSIAQTFEALRERCLAAMARDLHANDAAKELAAGQK